MTLTKGQIETFLANAQRDLVEDKHFAVHPAAMIYLCDLALKGLAVEQKWRDVGEKPPVETGSMGYYLVVTSRSKTAFGAYYLNQYLLRNEDHECPSASVENDFTPCKTCEDGDGHPYTGWFSEKDNFGEDWFEAFDLFGEFAVKMWTEPPASPLSSLPTLEVKP